MKIISILFIFIFPFVSTAQKKISNVPHAILAINDSLDKYRFVDTTQYLSMLQDLKYKASIREDDHYLAYYNFFLGFYKVDMGQLKAANKAFENALAILAGQDFIDHDLYFKIYYQQAYVKSRIGEIKESNKYYWACYDHAQKTKDSSHIAIASFGISNVLSEMGNYREAKKFANKTLEIDLALNDSVAIAYDYGSIALMYFKLKQYNEAESYYLKAIKFSDKIKSMHEYCNLNLALADVLIAKKEYQDAIKISDSIIDFIGDGKLFRFYIRARIHRAHASFYLDRKEIAFSEFDLILKECRANKYLREEIRTLILLGRMTEDVKMSYDYLLEAKTLIENSKASTYYPQVFRAMMNRSKEFEIENLNSGYKDEYIKYLEGIESKNQQSMIEGMDANFELHSMTELNTILKLENIQKKLELSNERSRNFIFAGLTGFLFISFLGFFFYSKQNRKIERLEYENQLSKLSQKLSDLDERASGTSMPEREIINEKLLSPLTPKEYEILIDILAQMTNPEIASKHFISINTVKFHLKNIFLKLEEPNKKRIIEKFKHS
jgi:DNA-binding CsgD family transcriptional regulator/tetratricopeptide (TPR) repeat protein